MNFKGRIGIVVIVILFLFLVIVLTTQPINHFNSQDSDLNDVTLPIENETIKIGISFDSFVVERWKRELEVMVSKANELGAEVIVQTANEDIEAQKEQILYLIEQKVDVIIIVPNDVVALQDVITKAKDRGIKVIAYDRFIKQTDYDLYISFDNKKIGKDITERLITELIKKRNIGQSENIENLESEVEDILPEPFQIIIINGDPKDNNSALLNEGYYDFLEPYIQSGEVEIVEEIWAMGWREKYASNLVEKNLKKNQKIDGIIAGNDVLASGAIEALSEWQKAGDVFVVSQDAELSACQRVVEGTQLATVYKPITKMAETCAEIAVDLALGKEVKPEGFIESGDIKIPFIYFDSVVVDIDNIDQIIVKSGFHREADVYLNISKE